jgi:hypothetical protein
LLAAPIAVLMTITLSHIDALHPFALFLSDTSDERQFQATRSEEVGSLGR